MAAESESYGVVCGEEAPFASPIRNSSRRVTSRTNRVLLGGVLLGEICVGIRPPIPRRPR